MQKTTRGFTIIELLVVIVVIAILASVTIAVYMGVQQRTRDADRVSDVNGLKKALDIFYATNGYYPAVNDITNLAYRQGTLKIPEGIVKAPNTSGAIGYCWSTNPNQYCYVGKAGPSGSFDCTTAGERCVGYYISYRLEGSAGTMITVEN